MSPSSLLTLSPSGRGQGEGESRTSTCPTSTTRSASATAPSAVLTPASPRAIIDALGPAASVVNVGAGAGSYEPADRRVVAVEPSREMIRQRPAGAAPVVQASATALPFAAGAFDAALAVLTVHHWPDRARGLAELRRVARDRVVILTWEPDAARFWLVEDYFPELVAIDRAIFPTRDELERSLGPVELRPLPIPHDCVDGFLGAYWRRPHAYLDRRGPRRDLHLQQDRRRGARPRATAERSRRRHVAPAPRRRCWSAPSSTSATAWSSPYRNPLPSGERAG